MKSYKYFINESKFIENKQDFILTTMIDKTNLFTNSFSTWWGTDKFFIVGGNPDITSNFYGHIFNTKDKHVYYVKDFDVETQTMNVDGKKIKYTEDFEYLYDVPVDNSWIFKIPKKLTTDNCMLIVTQPNSNNFKAIKVEHFYVGWNTYEYNNKYDRIERIGYYEKEVGINRNMTSKNDPKLYGVILKNNSK